MCRGLGDVDIAHMDALQIILPFYMIVVARQTHECRGGSWISEKAGFHLDTNYQNAVYSRARAHCLYGFMQRKDGYYMCTIYGDTLAGKWYPLQSGKSTSLKKRCCKIVRLKLCHRGAVKVVNPSVLHHIRSYQLFMFQLDHKSSKID